MQQRRFLIMKRFTKPANSSLHRSKGEPTGRSANPLTASRRFFWFGLIFLGLITLVLTQVGFQNDTFYTIKVGEHIAQSGIDGHDPFSWHDLPYSYPHWLFDLAIYGIYSLAGFTGIYLVTGLLAVILASTIFICLRRLVNNQLIAFVITLITMVALQDYLAARAQLVSFSLIFFGLYCLEQFLHQPRKRYVAGLVICPWLIANLHAAVFPAYFLIFLPYLAENFVAWAMELPLGQSRVIAGRIVITRRANAGKLWLIMLIGLATGLLTPLGLTPYTYLPLTLLGNSTRYISEHQPLAPLSNVPLLVTVIGYIAILVLSHTKFRLSDLLLVGSLGVMAILSGRQSSLFALLSTIPAAYLLVHLLADYHVDTRQLETNLVKPLGILTGALGGVVVIVGIVLLPQLNNRLVSDKVYPIQAAAWLKNHVDFTDPSTKLYNSYGDGAYLLYSGLPVFIDSRCDLYTPEFNGDKDKDIFTDDMKTENLNTYYGDTFAKYHISHIVVKNSSPLGTVLTHDSHAKQLYHDDNFSVYRWNN